MTNKPLLIVDKLTKYFPLKKDFFWLKQQWLKANVDISFSVNEGECIGIVGESGCGKSTLGKTLMNLYNKTSGEVYIKNPFYKEVNQRVIFNQTSSLKEILKEGLKKQKFYCFLDDIFLASFLQVSGFGQADNLYKELLEDEKKLFDIFYSSLNNPQYYPLHHLKEKKMREIRCFIQMIFQDPLGSLNPIFNIEKVLSEPFMIAGEKIEKDKLVNLVEKVGLDENTLQKYPHELSGGQQQRIGIARALARQPQMVVCDEPVSALDVSIQAQILNLLVKFQQELNLTMLLISHNLAVVKFIADRIIVMYLGEVVEIAKAEEIYKSPRHPYTESLVKAIPTLDRVKKNDNPLEGDVSHKSKEGCAFFLRCKYSQDKCKNQSPKLLNNVACHYPLTSTL